MSDSELYLYFPDGHISIDREEINRVVIEAVRDLTTTAEARTVTDNDFAEQLSEIPRLKLGILAILINRVANLIAARTRRGAGNYVVVSPQALTILQSATTSTFVRSTEGPFDAPTNSKFVGTLNGTVKVFVDNYAADGTAVLVGYKGSSETDAPAFYCPYIPLMSTGPVMDPSTFEPVVSFMTRYGYLELTNTASSLGNAADYLGEIGLSNVSFK